jgi:ABC-2 type transport system permease protein
MKMSIRALATMTWLEAKLFIRDPLTVVFSLALPLLMLFVLGEVFGNTPDPEGEFYRGVGAMNFYVPAYVGLVLAALGLLAMPVHLASYREHGVLRRYRASSVPVWVVLAAQALVTIAIAAIGGLLLGIAASFRYDIEMPLSIPGVIGSFVLGAASFVGVGALLGAVLPSARAAQGAGLTLFFLMFILGGGGPPPEVMTDVMQTIGEGLLLTHVVSLLQDPWLGFPWNWASIAAVTGTAVFAGTAAVMMFRRH